LIQKKGLQTRIKEQRKMQSDYQISSNVSMTDMNLYAIDQ